MRITTRTQGGNKINTAIKSIMDKILKHNAVLVGVPSGTQPYEDGVQTAVIAAVQEFGSADGRIPERSFLRTPLRSAMKPLALIVKNQMPSVIDGKITMHQLLNQLGAKGASVSQEAIADFIPPPLSPRTIAARRRANRPSDTPLLDTGHLRSSITYIVEGDS